jgi:hypothetical protein
MAKSNGESVDLRHSYAGIAALVMRDGEIVGTLMGRVNTGWGDSVQVWGSRAKSAGQLLKGVFTLSGDEIDKAGNTWSNSDAHKPPEQVRGNAIGNEARDYLQDHRSEKLSKAYEYAFRQVAGD